MISFAPEQGNTCVGSVSTYTTTTTSSSSISSRHVLALAVLALTTPSAHAWETTCSTFTDIYKDGKGLCENMFGGAFKYEEDESKAYTMWFFDRENPNEAIAQKLGMTVPETCDVQYYHKQGPPTAEGDDFTECLPWKEKACCHESQVTTADKLRIMYGPGYEWDRCGPMSQECHRFFVQEACLYECDVTLGNYRKCTDEQVAAAAESDPCFENTWEIVGMPIKASYCDSWFNACRNDYFCGGADGNFFSCSALYWEKEEEAKALAEEAAANKTAATEAALVNAKAEAAAAEAKAAEAAAEAKAAEAAAAGGMAGSTVAMIVIACTLAVGVPLIVFIFYMMKREKKGDPIFRNLVAASDPVEA